MDQRQISQAADDAHADRRSRCRRVAMLSVSAMMIVIDSIPTLFVSRRPAHSRQVACGWVVELGGISLFVLTSP